MKTIGLYSSKAERRFGHVVYKRPDGSEVAITCIVKDLPGEREHYAWDDVVEVGEVVPFEDGGFVRKVEPLGSYPLRVEPLPLRAQERRRPIP